MPEPAVSAFVGLRYDSHRDALGLATTRGAEEDVLGAHSEAHLGQIFSCSHAGGCMLSWGFDVGEQERRVARLARAGEGSCAELDHCVSVRGSRDQRQATALGLGHGAVVLAFFTKRRKK